MHSIQVMPICSRNGLNCGISRVLESWPFRSALMHSLRLSLIDRSASNRENTSLSSFCTTVIQKSLSLIESVYVCVRSCRCRPWRSHLHFGYHRRRLTLSAPDVCASAPRTPAETLLHASSSSLPGAVFNESSHTLSAPSSIAFPLSSSYLFSMSLTFCTSVHIIVCIDLSLPCVSSLLSLPGLALAPPSGPSAIVFGRST